LAIRSFGLTVEPAGVEWLLDNGVSAQYGARELKRTLHKHFFHPVAALAAKRRIAPRSEVIFDANNLGPVIYIRDDVRKRRVA
jgi:ATP-dependent Clp protease ATP-binding subunit ClpA